MYNDIMAVGSKDRPLMLAPGRYAHWQSCFLRYVDTKSNKIDQNPCIYDGPYVMTEVTIPAKPSITTEQAEPEHNVPKTYGNTTPKKRAYIDAEAEAIHMILSGIGDEIYSTIDACTTAKEMWIAIERLQQGELLNKQDVKTNLFWEVMNQKTVIVVGNKETRGNQDVLHVTDDKSVPTYDVEPLEKVQTYDEYNMFANQHEHTDQPKNINNTSLMEKVDSNTTPDSSDMCNNEFEDDQNINDDEDEHAVLANLIENLKLDIDENKKIQKQLRKANATLTHEPNESKYALTESNDIRDRCKSALHQKEIELENDLQGNDLRMGTRGSYLYTIALQESSTPTLICFMEKATPTQAWLWHHRLSHLNFDTINLLSKNDIVSSLPKLNPMRVKSINGKKYILVIVDDYSRYTWTRFLGSKDETSEVLIDFLKKIKRGLQAQVITVRTNRGLEIQDHNNEQSSSKLVPKEIKVCQSLFLSLSDNSIQQDTQPTLNVQPILEPIIPPTNVNAEANKNDQTENAQFKAYKYINPFAPLGPKDGESSSRNEEVYVNQPDGFIYPYHLEKVFHLWKALYGLKQYQGAWYNELSTFLISKGFSKALVHQIAIKPKVDADLNGTPVDQTRYQSMIGSLMYLTSNRPNLVQAVFYCARYQARPMEKYLKEVKRIFRYLKSTINMGLWYSKDSGFKLISLSLNTRKITFRGIQLLGDKLVSWMSKKHDYTAMSTAEAEYVDLSVSYAQIIWMRTQLKDYGFDYNRIPLY
nr:retrovirus-related Pol polyprotein from transposon TNT 1-94 [Tanacetum cinerariifolium]